MSNLYETDYHQWLGQQANLLANKQFNELDLENLIAELEMSREDEIDKLESFLLNLVLHLLKCDYQTTVLKDGCNTHFIPSWLTSISNRRRDIQRIIKKHKSVEKACEEALVNIYPEAKQGAIEEMNKYARSEDQKLTTDSFPDTCPWSYEKIMDSSWEPLNGVDLFS
ncbi:DUF29 domain-containing protein [Endozoicomonas sp. 4G]|uniref:DUF29 domain-containing protein n=1 Tax=Endozoicomonas sp. 4G TaxID=2872754 RepID=UPI002078D2EE|nr:DUF29 domain-containing protein [Endozoicomonas sp. 4G]